MSFDTGQKYTTITIYLRVPEKISKKNQETTQNKKDFPLRASSCAQLGVPISRLHDFQIFVVDLLSVMSCCDLLTLALFLRLAAPFLHWLHYRNYVQYY